MSRPTLLLLALALTAPPVHARELPRNELVPGGIAVLPLGLASSGARPQAHFEGARVMVIEHRNQWTAVVGLPLSLAPAKPHAVSVSAPGAATRAVPLRVKPKRYPEQRIRLPDDRMVELSPGDLARHERERIEIRAALETWSDNEDPPLRFALPAAGRLSSRFGLRRFFNDKPRAPHSGLDIAAPSGTPVRSPAAGSVIVTGDYFFNGLTVFIDHGQGLVSMFNHLHRVMVRPGDRVVTGQPIGEIGRTGRATGAHLHWTVVLNGTAVDPELLFDSRAVRNGAETVPGS
jgi:murein DD-endopeptidase MepM/ murein hydrolase activator NlpD